jgi:hypothetical protein
VNDRLTRAITVLRGYRSDYRSHEGRQRSSDGRFVLCTSSAPNSVSGDKNNVEDLFLSTFRPLRFDGSTPQFPVAEPTELLDRI